MQKLLISWVLGATLLSTGCSTFERIGNAIPDSLDRMPLVYRLDIQQGNMVDQETVNRLQMGMSKSQVRYLMGTPMLVDVFHQDRWDYIYSMQHGKEEREQIRVALLFSDDRLVDIQGDLTPQPSGQTTVSEETRVVDVPDYEPGKKGIVTRMMEKVGLKSGEERE